MNATDDTLRIEGMTCAHCVAAVRGALEGLPGVEVDDVSLGEARVRYDPAVTDRARLAAAVEEEGYRLADVPPALGPETI